MFLTRHSLSTTQLIEDCRSMLDGTANMVDSLDPEILELGRQILDDASSANSDRNRFVHDVWFPSQEETTKEWRRLRVAKKGLANAHTATPASTVEVHKLVQHLDRTMTRIGAMNFAFQCVLPFYQGQAL
jgi:hypothetical protein